MKTGVYAQTGDIATTTLYLGMGISDPFLSVEYVPTSMELFSEQMARQLGIEMHSPAIRQVHQAVYRPALARCAFVLSGYDPDINYPYLCYDRDFVDHLPRPLSTCSQENLELMKQIISKVPTAVSKEAVDVHTPWRPRGITQISYMIDYSNGSHAIVVSAGEDFDRISDMIDCLLEERGAHDRTIRIERDMRYRIPGVRRTELSGSSLTQNPPYRDIYSRLLAEGVFARTG